MTLTILLIIFTCFSFYDCCPTGWDQDGDKCYFFSQQIDTWSGSASICRSFGSKLAEPKTPAETSFLISHSQREAGTFWIGISDIIEEDRWMYSTDQVPVPEKVKNFQPGEPNAHTSANCVALWRPFHGKWADESCLAHYRFICEQDNEIKPEVLG